METWLEKTTVKQCHVSSLLGKDMGPPMYMSGGKNISGRGTRKWKALELGTDLVMC